MYEKHIFIFNKLSSIYEKLGDEIRATAYHNLAKRLELGELTGITSKSKEKIEEITNTGNLTLLKTLENSKNVKERLRLTGIIGFGPKKAQRLVARGVTTLAKIKKLDKLTSLQKLGIKYYNKISYPTINTFKKITTFIKNNTSDLVKIEIAGSFRTGDPNPGDIDIIICTKNGDIKDIVEKMQEKNILVDYVKTGENDILGFIKINDNFFRIDIKCVVPKYLASYLLFFGSGKYFSKYTRQVAKKNGYLLNQYGVKDRKTKELKTFRTEKAILKFLDIPYYTPEERKKYF